jgi:deoxyadenosine/deoxycytidine kinase
MDPAGNRSNLVYVSGNIAAGKSTVSRLLSEDLGARLVREDVAGNPYLARFYDDMPGWSFHVDVHFLAARAGDVRREFRAGGPPVVFDRCYAEGAVFARAALDAGVVTADEHATFGLLLDTVDALLPPPAVLVRLTAPPDLLLARVGRRGRPYEQGMTLDYLALLEQGYDDWFAGYDRSPTVLVDTAAVDLRSDDAARARLLAEVAAALA